MAIEKKAVNAVLIEAESNRHRVRNNAGQCVGKAAQFEDGGITSIRGNDG